MLTEAPVQTPSTGRTAIEAKDLMKVYPPDIRAVDGISFRVLEGEIFGLLGPNGAGKTTTMKMITTLTRPTSGSLTVFGMDVESSSERVRELLGYVPQSISVDGDLSAYENLLIFSKLFYVDRDERQPRIRAALEYMGLSERANERVKRFSGGMMRRLEIAQTLVNRPKLLFLDEPSIGLDPNSRRDVWESILRLRQLYDTTIFLSTHDMNEADLLCDRIAIIDSGKIAASGSPRELKRSVGGDMVSIEVGGGQVDNIPQELGSLVRKEENRLEILVENGEQAVPRILAYLGQAGVSVDSVSVNSPSLDDVFMKYTKKRLHEDTSYRDARATRRSFMRHAR